MAVQHPRDQRLEGAEGLQPQEQCYNLILLHPHHSAPRSCQLLVDCLKYCQLTCCHYFRVPKQMNSRSQPGWLGEGAQQPLLAEDRAQRPLANPAAAPLQHSLQGKTAAGPPPLVPRQATEHTAHKKSNRTERVNVAVHLACKLQLRTCNKVFDKRKVPSLLVK